MAGAGSLVGAAVALAHVPPAHPAAAPGAPRLAADVTSEAQTKALAAAVDRANRLQSMIVDLRRQVMADEQAATTGGSQVVIEHVSTPAAAGNSAAAQSRLNAEQAQINGEQSQLAAEQAALAAERNSLATAAAQLQTEQAEIQKEQEALAQSQTATTTATTSAPPTTAGSEDPSGDH